MLPREFMEGELFSAACSKYLSQTTHSGASHGMMWTCVRALNLWALLFFSKYFTPRLSFQADAYIVLNATTALGLFDKEVLLGLFKDSSVKRRWSQEILNS